MTTLVLNRCILNVRRAEVIDAYRAPTPEGLLRQTVSPFGWNGLPSDYDDVFDIYGEITEREIPIYNERLPVEGPLSETPLAIELKKFVPWSGRHRSAGQSRESFSPSILLAPSLTNFFRRMVLRNIGRQTRHGLPHIQLVSVTTGRSSPHTAKSSRYIIHLFNFDGVFVSICILQSPSIN